MGADVLTPTHLIFLLLLALLLFGSKRLPEMGRSLGNGIREFKSTVSGLDGVTEAANSLNEIRSAVSPASIARATIPGVSDVQDTLGAAKSAVAPAAAESAAGETAASAVPPPDTAA